MDDPASHGSDNNRLAFYQEFDTSGGGSVLAATTWYFYNESGNVTRVVSKQASGIAYTADRLGCFSTGQAVEYLLGESWSWYGNPNHDPTAYNVTYARAFRCGYETGCSRQPCWRMLLWCVAPVPNRCEHGLEARATLFQRAADAGHGALDDRSAPLR